MKLPGAASQGLDKVLERQDGTVSDKVAKKFLSKVLKAFKKGETGKPLRAHLVVEFWCEQQSCTEGILG